MKRLTCLLAALLMMISCAGAEKAGTAAEAADGGKADLMDIWQTDGESRTWITAAVQAMDGMLLTSPGLLPAKTDSLTVSDGLNEWKVEAVITDSTGMMAMVFFDTEQKAPQQAALPLMSYGDSAKASECLVRSGNADGSRNECGILNAALLKWKGCRCLLLDLEEEVPLGAAVLNEKGELAGIVVAGYAEGQKRVLALTAVEIVRGLTEAGKALAYLPSWGNPVEGFSMTAEKNLVTIDWSAAALPEKAEGEILYVVVADTENNYLNFFPAETSGKAVRLLLTPGRIYVAGILASALPPADLPEHYEVAVIPKAQKLTEYGFSPTLTAIAEMPEDAKEGQAPDPVTEVTEELLRSGRAYFYSASTYEVAERIPDQSLLVTLTDPEGNNYRYESAWVYAPEYMQEDIWYIALSGTGLTYSLDQSGYPRGEYQMAYYVNGDLADAFTFELK